MDVQGPDAPSSDGESVEVIDTEFAYRGRYELSLFWGQIVYKYAKVFHTNSSQCAPLDSDSIWVDESKKLSETVLFLDLVP